MEINERIRFFRESKGIKQNDLSNKIGLKPGSLSDIERGKTKKVTERVIKDICREYGVNEDWLRTGEGEMLKDIDVIDEINSRFELTEIQKVFVQQLMSLSPEKKKVIDELIMGMYIALKKEGL